MALEDKIFEALLEMKEEIGTLKNQGKQILEQTTKTNGRVNKLEDRVKGLEDCNITAAGKKSVWAFIGKYGYEGIRLIAAAVVGAYFGGKKG